MSSSSFHVICIITIFAHVCHAEKEDNPFINHHALGYNPYSQHIADHFPYKPQEDWTSHLEEEWTFLDKEPERTLADVIATEPTDTYEVVYDVMKRVLGTNSDLISSFNLELIVAKERAATDLPSFLSKSKHSNHPFWQNALYLDVMELDNNGTNGIILRGSSTIALIVAFNWYLESYCNTTYDWRTYSIELPNILPLPSFTRNIRSVPFSYYENVCTVSYTQAFWNWNEWQKHLDWMAMQGINLPLAFTGQEYIFSKAFYKYNFTQSDLQHFFSGPGFFAWQRMGNLRGWGGAITEQCIMDQYELQLNILARMNSFGMIPALTAFAGHVPYAITTYYPEADITPSPNWGGFPEEYCCDLLLNFTDPLFSSIGSTFIEMQTKYFGTGHIYQCDTFNEMHPPTNDPTYLRDASRYIYESMNKVDESAVWLMQGWLFQDLGFWTPAAVNAYVNGVPHDALIILDLYDDVSPRYNRFDSFYGTPFIWNTLHNFGGNQGMLGTLYNIAVGVPQAKQYPNSTIIGVGITMEGIWQNYIVYDETLKMAFAENELDLDAFVNKYAVRRYGLPFTVSEIDGEQVVNSMQSAWRQLADTVYNISHWGGVTKNIMVIVPSLHAIAAGFMPTKILYDPIVIQDVWQKFLSVAQTDVVHVEKYRYDLIDVTRQALSDQFNAYYQQLNASYYAKSTDGIKKYGGILMELITDLDDLLNTNKYWMLGEWIAMARTHATDKAAQDWWEFNARNQVTLWGPYGEISNYASKTWGGLLARYHGPQWQLFINELLDALQNNVTYDQSAFVAKNMQTIEQPWQQNTDAFPVEPINDTIVVACNLYRKWNTLQDTKTCKV